ncbi:MAG: PAS domain-containing sensor histidine kinase, partial [Ktedonobacterales bacterium]
RDTSVSADAAALVRYQHLFAYMAEGVVFQDADGRVIDANPAALHLLGLTLDQLLGTTSFDPHWRAIHRDGSEAPAEEHPASIAQRTGQPVRDEILGVFIPREERYRWLHVTAIPEIPAGSERPMGVVVTFDDFTEWEDNARAAVRAQEARYQALLEQAGDAIFVAAPDERIIEANPVGCRLLGYEREALLGQRMRDLIPLEEMGRFEGEQAKVLAGHAHRGRWRLRRRDGQYATVELTGGVQPDGRRLAIVRDITERQRLEGELAERVQEIETIFETTVDGIMHFDTEGRILRMNPALCRFFGYDTTRQGEHLTTADFIQQFDIRDAQGQLLAPEERAPYRILQGETLTGQEAVGRRLRAVHGREMWVSISGAPVRNQQGQIAGGVLSIRDITEQQRLERELAARAQEIETIFQTDADGVILYDSEGRAIRMNNAMRRLLGLDATSRANMLTPEERAQRISTYDAKGRPLAREDWPVARVLRGETLTGQHAVDLRLRTLDEREIWVSISGAPVRNQQGNIVGGVTAARDVTQQRSLEQQRNDVLRVVTHDLASPIAAVRMYLQTQQRGIDRGEPPRVADPELLETMTHAVSRIQRLLEDMRLVVGLEGSELPLHPRPCDLVALCEQEVQALRMTQPDRNIQVYLPEGAVTTDVDPERIGQVLANLLSNADKYSPIEQPITLTLRIERPKRGRRSVHGAPTVTYKQARILVQDAGPGLPPEEKEHIWERFHRVSSIQPRPGMGVSLGLGLYICREIVVRHSGTVGVESTPGEGSTFWFTVPLL